MTELFEEMKDYAVAHEIPVLRDAEIPLLQNIVSRAKPARILEIGTAIGYSALHMAPLLAPGGQIVTIELNRDRVATAKAFIDRTPYKQCITLLDGDATALLDTLQGPWDLVFLDGPKGQYSRQLVKLLPQLAPQAVVVADNILYHGMLRIKGTIPHKHRTIVMRLREYMKLVTEDSRFKTVFYENGDGMTVSYWKG